MPVTDPISDMLTRMRNAIMVHHDSVSIPASKLKESLLKLMKEEGFINDFVKENGDSREVFEVNLRYYDDDTPVINGLKRISKPGLREYTSKNEKKEHTQFYNFTIYINHHHLLDGCMRQYFASC